MDAVLPSVGAGRPGGDRGVGEVRTAAKLDDITVCGGIDRGIVSWELAGNVDRRTGNREPQVHRGVRDAVETNRRIWMFWIEFVMSWTVFNLSPSTPMNETVSSVHDSTV